MINGGLIQLGADADEEIVSAEVGGELDKIGYPRCDCVGGLGGCMRGEARVRRRFRPALVDDTVGGAVDGEVCPPMPLAAGMAQR